MPNLPTNPDAGLAVEIGALLLRADFEIIPNLDGATRFSFLPDNPHIVPTPQRDAVVVAFLGKGRGRRGVAFLPAGSQFAYTLVHRVDRTLITTLGGDNLDRVEAIAAASGQLGKFARSWDWAGWTPPPTGRGVWKPGKCDRHVTRLWMTDARGKVWHVERSVWGFVVRRPDGVIPRHHPNLSCQVFRDWLGAMHEAERQAADYIPHRRPVPTWALART